MKNYKEVPNILTGKDLDYLSDFFNWNHNAYKIGNHIYENIANKNFKGVIEKSNKLFKDSMDETLTILQGGLNE